MFLLNLSNFGILCELLVHNFVAVSLMLVLVSNSGVAVLVEHIRTVRRRTLGLSEFVGD